MAKDSRDRRREREDEQEAAIGKHKQDVVQKSGGGPATPGMALTADKFDEIMERAGPMIDQLNNLYNMFFAGAEKMPPIERRKQLDQIMVALTSMPKATASQRFKFTTLQGQYTTFRDKWDKQMKDVESGKLKRRSAGPLGRA